MSETESRRLVFVFDVIGLTDGDVPQVLAEVAPRVTGLVRSLLELRAGHVQSTSADFDVVIFGIPAE